jgi:hypothetical protein
MFLDLFVLMKTRFNFVATKQSPYCTRFSDDFRPFLDHPIQSSSIISYRGWLILQPPTTSKYCAIFGCFWRLIGVCNLLTHHYGDLKKVDRLTNQLGAHCIHFTESAHHTCCTHCTSLHSLHQLHSLHPLVTFTASAYLHSPACTTSLASTPPCATLSFMK